MNGSRSVFWTRSAWTVCVVCSTGMLGSVVLPSWSVGIGSPFGWQSMKYSAISDCGSDEHSLSAPSCDSGPRTSTVTTARFWLVDVEVGDRARGDPGDPHLGALDEPERVVELDRVGVAVVVGAGARDDAARRRRAGAGR